MEDMGLIFIPALVRCSLSPPGLSGPMTGTSWTHRTSKQSGECSHLQLLTYPHPPTPLYMQSVTDITAVVKKLLEIQQC